MDDYSPACQSIFARAGSALKEEIYDEVKGSWKWNDISFINSLSPSRRSMKIFVKKKILFQIIH